MKTETNWHIERFLFLIGGIFSLIGVSVGFFITQWGYLLNLLVALNMILYAGTGFCLMAFLLKRIGVPTGCKITPIREK
ncbi:PF11127 family protein [Leptospira fainei serovar Hurstbridge str. BUT 6]|uniref:PF11127 family protein n=1 Tax=Leptospira fainei serovar Hurstbridge str. BUT 6 TaxID=1193011 RepID=S3VWN1_9LEPT|nr:hypothetical protein [Leptospira fainei]EPG72512.1 PF11127 family protein [Leptospira fainei serovar Hurstbridge str. BUT 6]